MQEYIAAGFDPARFWEITPRLYVVEMRGAARRAEARRAEIWMTAMLPYMKEPIPFDEFVSGQKNRRAAMVKCLDAWDRVDRALAASRKS